MTSDEFVAGNVTDKYGTSNPIVTKLMRGYFSSFERLLSGLLPDRVLEVGCGEGNVIERLSRIFPDASLMGLDLSIEMTSLASVRVDRAGLICSSAEALPLRDNSFDLVVCVEVLEHLFNPEVALAEMRRVAAGRLLFSVPNEPLWRVLNLARAAYLSRLGNTPGHVQHWSPRSFIEFLSASFEVLVVDRPVPWTMVLCAVPGKGD